MFQNKYSPSQRRYGKSCCVWMDPHLLLCADSGAPILQRKTKRGGKLRRGKHTINPSPQKTILDPPLAMISFPPPPLFVHAQ